MRTIIYGLIAAAIASPTGADVPTGRRTDEPPRINAPAAVGGGAKRPFLYRVPVTGTRPMRFSAQGLPSGLRLDGGTGIISGKAPGRSASRVAITATNAFGSATKDLRVVIGDQLLLTPAMGWSSWNTLQVNVTDKAIREQADALVALGLADHGYSFVNVDDGWTEPVAVGGGRARNPDGSIRVSKRFPDMKGLADYIHSAGLKFGLYSSPGPRTCAGFEGSLGHEAQDAKRMADWGIDFLKYDWCSYKPKDASLAEMQKPYRQMATQLAALDRDIVFSLCQYGMGNVRTWGRRVGGQQWRIAGDLAWGPKGIYSSWDNIVALVNGWSGKGQAGPGGWSDPDHLLVGRLAYIPRGQVWPNVTIDRVMPPPLTPDQQFFQFSLWSLLSAPLIIGGDLTTMDEFSLSILTNDEVIDVDQDALGIPAERVSISGPISIWRKYLATDEKAVGIFNTSDTELSATVRWSDIGIVGRHKVRDLWRHADIGASDREVKVLVPALGTRLLKLRSDPAPGDGAARYGSHEPLATE